MVKSVIRPSLNVYQLTGATVTIVDPLTGTTKQTLGEQPDGSVTLVDHNGAPPPAPSTPVVAAASLGLVITWDGLRADSLIGAPINSNPDFVTGIDPWVDNGGAVSWSSTQSFSGTHALQVTPVGEGYPSAGARSELLPVTAGQSYRADSRIWLTTAVTNGFALAVDWYDGDGNYLSTAANPASATAHTWTEVINTVTPPTGASFAALSPALTAGSGTSGEVTSADVFYVDAVTLAAITSGMPDDFDHVAVHVSPLSGFTPNAGTLQGTLNKPGSFPVTPLDSDMTYYAALVGVNTSGITGATSAQASGVPTAVVATDIADGIVTTLKLADDAVTQAKIAAGAVGTGEIQGQAVDLSKLADGSVNAAKLVPGAVGPTQLADSAVQTAKLANNAVSASKIISGAVGSDALAVNAVIAGKVAANAIGADQITANAITTGKIAADAITAAQISAGAIGATELAANSVVAGKIAANAVDAAQLVAGSIQTSKIAAGAVDTAQLAAEAVTTANLEALAVTAAKIAANTITAGQIAAGAVTADKLAATLVLASQIIAGQTDGARMQLDQTGLSAYNTDGVSTVMIGSDGSALFNGDAIQANTIRIGSRLTLTNGGPLILYSTGVPLNTNSDFATGIIGWNADSHSALVYSSLFLFNGHSTMRVGRDNAHFQRGCTSSTVTVTAGEHYTAQVYVYNDGSSSPQPARVYAGITWRDAGGALLLRSSGATTNLYNQFTLITAEDDAPAGATQAVIHIQNSEPGPSGSGDFFVGYGALTATTGISASLAATTGTDDNGVAYPAGFQTTGNITANGGIFGGNLDADAVSIDLTTGTGTPRLHHISFNRTFTAIPVVVTCGDTTRPDLLVNVGDRSTTGFNVTCRASNTDVTNSTVTVEYIAYLPPS